jgi:dUTP pyrophosphatase
MPILDIPVNSSVTIPTGIRCKIDEGWVLQIYPRSGHGFKYGVHLANSCGIIDEDYYGADNEGHIQVKLVNDSLLKKQIELAQGDGFCQGVFVPYGITVDDEANAKRVGGFGSTDNK